MLHFKKHPANVIKAYPFAAVAKMEGIAFCYFSFDRINFTQKSIDGWVYENGKWLQKTLEIPKVIINSCNPKTISQKEILQRLKRLAKFTSHSVGNKWLVYNKVLESGVFSQYLIPTFLVGSANEAICFLERERRAVFKPLKGNHGKYVFFLEKLNGLYKVTDGPAVSLLNGTQLAAMIEGLIREKKFLLQPFIECKTMAGLTYDFRLHVQKNGKGLWEISLIYPRISTGGKLVSNVASGGCRGELESFLQEEYGGDVKKVKGMLEEFALKFPVHFESLYQHPFDELGIDIGIDEHRRPWIFEVNWRPGSKHREFEVAKRLIPYCRYLAEKQTDCPD